MTTLTAPLRHGTPQRHPPCTRCSGLVTADSQGGLGVHPAGANRVSKLARRRRHRWLERDWSLRYSPRSPSRTSPGTGLSASGQGRHGSWSSA